MENKTAKEMFEELGYNPVVGYDIGIHHDTTAFVDDYCDKRIVFDPEWKTYTFYGETTMYETPPGDTSVKLHKAIHQFMKELGWLDE